MKICFLQNNIRIGKQIQKPRHVHGIKMLNLSMLKLESRSRQSPKQWNLTPLHAEKSGNIGFTGDRKWARPSLVKVERVAIEVSEHMVLKHLLVTVEGKLLATHGADFPVALHVLLKLVLIVVGREDDLAERTALHVHAANTGEKMESQLDRRR